MRISDWSSDVCSSDLQPRRIGQDEQGHGELLQPRSTSSTAWAKACGASCGMLWPMPPVIRRCRSEEHTSELQSLMRISYAVFCLKKKTKKTKINVERRLTTDTVYSEITSDKLITTIH